jgi:hypothetical protein
MEPTTALLVLTLLAVWLQALPPRETCSRGQADRTDTAPLDPCPHCGADSIPF